MDIQDIVEIWLRENGFDGLCRDGCGCGLEDLMPCCEPSSACESARMRILGPDEYLGDCGPGEGWFEPAKQGEKDPS